MTKIVQCPDEYYSKLGEFAVFMAGGISGCENWQQEMIAKVGDLSDVDSLVELVLLNPRRDNFDVNDSSMSDWQIEWEHRQLTKADATSFWFPRETLCPITLYELGKCSYSLKNIFVGTHPDYKRRYDVIKQLSLVRPNVVVVSTLDDLVDQIKKLLGVWNK